ncbi:MAG: hypothetical protein U9N85_01245 [Bacteroidota bacterium]|nr:hypothetical protein [Bacteroidota bacterium]
MTKFYNDILCIEARWLYEDAGVMTKDNYDQLLYRGHISQLRRGGNGRTALIEWESLPVRFKKQVNKKIGNPYEYHKTYYIKSLIEHNATTLKYFSELKEADGSYIATERAKEYYQNAILMRVITRLQIDVTARRKAMQGKSTGLWQNIADSMNSLRDELGHNLPNNPRSLKRKWKRFQADGLQSLVHGGRGNVNSLKVNVILERLILSIYVMNNKPYPNMVLDTFHKFLSGSQDLVDKKTGELFDREDFRDHKAGGFIKISESTIRNYIEAPHNRALVDSKRNDFHYYNNIHRPHHHRHVPEFSLSKISLDDRDLVRKYKQGKEKLRAKAYYVYDVTSGALIGYSHSKKKDDDLFISCIRNMFLFLHRNKMGVPMQAEVEHHLVNKYKDDLMKAGTVFPHMRWCNAGNSQEKHAERFIGVKKYGYEKRHQDGIGRYTLSEANRPKQSKVWDAEGMHISEKLYTYEQIVADDIYTINAYNNDLHPKQKKYPGMSRMDVLKSKLNKDLIKYDEALLAKYIGIKTETSIRRNQYLRAVNEKYQLPNVDVIDRLQPGNYKVTAYYLPASDGTVDTVHLYQNEKYITSCNKLVSYNEATSEQTDTDRDAYSEFSKYVAQFDSKIKKGRKDLADIEIIDVEKDSEPELVEIHKGKKKKDEWDKYGNDEETSMAEEELAVDNI